MGNLTKDQIITQGMKLAGKETTNLASLVGTGFDAWLRSTYKGWAWPYLVRQCSAVTLATAAQSVTVGRSSGSALTDRVDEIYDPLYLFTSDYAYVGRARVRQLRGGAAEREPSIIKPSDNKGTPLEFKARLSDTTEGQWVLTPYPFPDKTYLLVIDYKHLPESITGSEYPRFENDRTLIQAAKVLTLEYMKDETYGPELEVLSSMVLQDFAKDAAKTGTNDRMLLDSNLFKGT